MRTNCTQCEQPMVYNGFVMCEECRAYHRRFYRLKHKERREAGLCYCGNKRMVKKYATCASCRRRGRERYAAKTRTYYRTRYQTRRDAGVCTGCGRMRDNARFLRCDRCRTSSTESQRKLLQKNVAAGLCYCGRKHESKYKHCTRCRARHAKQYKKLTSAHCKRCGKKRDNPDYRRCDSCRTYGRRWIRNKTKEIQNENMDN